MSKVKTGTEEVVTPNAESLAVMQGGNAVATYHSAMTVGAFDLGDDESTGSAARPTATLRISHNLSDKEPEGCPKGSVWLSRKSDVVWSCMLSKLGQKFRFIPFAVSHVWREIVPYGTGAIPQEWATRDDAVKAGRICEFQSAESGRRRDCAPLYKMWSLVEANDNAQDESYFYLSLDGKAYAPVEMYVDKYKSYVSLKSVLQNAATILSVKQGKPLNAVNLSGLVFEAGTEYRDVKVESSIRKIPYLFFNLAKDDKGVVQFTSDKFMTDLAQSMSSMAPTDVDPVY